MFLIIIVMKLAFQIIDCDYFLNGEKPVVRLFGKTEEGKNVTLFDENFKPYFYIKKGTNFFSIKNNKEVVNIEEVEMIIPKGYRNQKEKLNKITVVNPRNVPEIREKFLSENIAEEIFEADILFKYRYMIDNNLFGMGWAEAEVNPVGETKYSKNPAYQVESIKKIDKKKDSDMKILSFDIECLAADMTKQMSSETDEIIMISMAFSHGYRGMKDYVILAKNFTNKNTKGFSSEKEMLEEFMKIIKEYDPDILTGYNINAFDLEYIMTRMGKNNLIPFLGRCGDKPAYQKKIGLMVDTIITGRVVFDPYQILKRDPWLKFHKYDLNTIAKAMINETKMDLKYQEIPSLWNGDIKGLQRLVDYARKDSDLVLKMVIKKNMLDKFIEISKISGNVLQDTFGGQTSRIENMILYEFKKRGYVMTSKPTEREIIGRSKDREATGLKGGMVLEPVKGLHSEGCILVLDFKSLYPSIMKTFNVSPDTLIIDDLPHEGSMDTPLGAKFVSQKERVGVLPFLLTILLDARSEAKKEMKTADDAKKASLNARQLALKDMANSFYGYTGYIRARLYMEQVVSSITAIGRDNIEKTKNLIENNFDVKIVYGDTDSVFVKTKTDNLDEAKENGDKISDFVSGKLPGHLMLEFEKIYRTFLILSKKRYAAWKMEYNGDSWEEDIEMKGIETVRRDWCSLVSETMEKILIMILKEGDIKKSVDEVKIVLEKLKKNEIPIDKLTVIKGITKDPDRYEGKLPHIEVAKKIKRRNPQDPPKVGDRIGYVITKGDVMLSDRAEDPNFVIEKNLDIDPDYYINYQLFPPIERIFSSLGITKSEIFGNGRQVSISDIINGSTLKMKHDIKIEYKKSKTLDDWEKFVCDNCSKQYENIPMKGICDCGGKLMLSYKGVIGNKIVKK